jgi:HAD superfamily hydrolase (TIGR01549 family)
MGLRALLFDLDGTLLPIDTDQFIASYVKKLAGYVAHLVDPEVFVKQLMASTYAMINNDEDHKTNREVFEHDFFVKIGRQEEITPLIDRFYEKEFPKLSEFVSSHGFIPELIQAGKEKGYRMVIATNPLFPRAAILERIRWAGANPDDFDWITTYEVSHYCKPNPKYYLEISERIGVKPEECLMVGNDVQEDLVAQTVGFKTFLVTDKKIDRGEPVFVPHGEGTMRQFYEDLIHNRGIFG